MSKNKKSSQFSRVYRTDETTLIPIIQGSPLFNAIITPEDFASGLFPFLGIDNKVDKLSGHSLVPDEEIVKLKAIDSSGQLDLSSIEILENKQNSLEPDETELKYPTVKAVIEGLGTKVNIEEGKSLVDNLEIERLSTVTNQDISNLVEKIEGYSLVKDTDIAKLEALTDTGEIDLSHLELTENKQNSLLEDTSGVKFPTVNAVNEGLDTKVDKEVGKSLVNDEEILRLSSVVNQDISNLVEKEAGKSLIDDTEIARLATLENVSIEHLATKEELESKVDKEVGKSLISDAEILRLSTVTNQDIEHLASKDELSNKVDKEEGKVLIEQTELTRLAGVTNQDISNLATKGDLDNLVVKEEGKSLVDDEEIARLALVSNQDISHLATKNELENLVIKEAGKSLILDTEIERLESVTNQTLEGLGGEDINNKKSLLNPLSETEYPNSKAVADYITDRFNSLELAGNNFTGSEVDLSNPLGAYQVTIANTSTAYTLSANKVIGGWSKIKINASTEPTVTDGIKIKGSDFTASTDMYLLAEYNGTTTEYYFAKI